MGGIPGEKGNIPIPTSLRMRIMLVPPELSMISEPDH